MCAFSSEEAAQVVGGMLYLHERKATESWFGGRINGFREVEIETVAHNNRIVFTLTFLEKGGMWSGAVRTTAWRGRAVWSTRTTGSRSTDLPSAGLTDLGGPSRVLS